MSNYKNELLDDLELYECSIDLSDAREEYERSLQLHYDYEAISSSYNDYLNKRRTLVNLLENKLNLI